METPAGRITASGTALRVAFFVGTAVVGLWVFGLVFLIFGPVVAGTFGLFATGCAANLLTMKIFDRRPFAEIGLAGGRRGLHNLVLGIALGGGTAALMLLAPILAGAGHLVARPTGAALSWATLAFYLAVLIFGAAGEEMMFRGYAFQLLIEKMGPFATVLPTGALFGVVHSFNPHATMLAIFNTAIWGILFGFAFLRSRDLWLPIGLHYGWNAVLPLFGVNLSGLTIEVTRYFYRWDLRPLWSGGDYGPEGGLLTTIFALALFAALWRIPVKPQRAAIATVLNDEL